jgi:hypothetical protein
VRRKTWPSYRTMHCMLYLSVSLEAVYACWILSPQNEFSLMLLHELAELHTITATLRQYIIQFRVNMSFIVVNIKENWNNFKKCMELVYQHAATWLYRLMTKRCHDDKDNFNCWSIETSLMRSMCGSCGLVVSVFDSWPKGSGFKPHNGSGDFVPLGKALNTHCLGVC